jgi:hypothetical protein
VTGRIWKEQTNPDGACIPNLCSWGKKTLKTEWKIVLFGWLVFFFQNCHVVVFSL